MIIRLFAIGIFLILQGSALAQEGPYLSGNLGMGLMDNLDGDDLASNDGRGHFDAIDVTELGIGVVGEFAFGWDFGSHRWELQLAFRDNDPENLTGVQFPDKNPLVGHTRSTTFMVNGIKEIENSSNWTPYLGAGIGTALVDLKFGIQGQPSLVDETHLSFAYQLIGGIDYEVSEQWDVGLKYSFFSVFDTAFEKGPGFAVPAGLEDYEVQYNHHSMTLGVKYRF